MKDPDYLEEWLTYNMITNDNKKYTINIVFSLLMVFAYLGIIIIMMFLGAAIGFSLGEEKNLATPQTKEIQIEEMYEHIDVENGMCVEANNKE